MKNKIISCILSICLFANMFVSFCFADNQINGVNLKLDDLLKIYDNDSYFTADGESCEKSCDNCLLSNIPEKDNLPDGQTVSDIYGDGYSCVAFARYVFYYLFECNPEQTDVVDSPSIGDYISLNDGKHTAIYLWEDDNYIYVYNSNGDRLCGVEYEQAFSKSKWHISTVIHADNYDEVYNILPQKPEFDFQMKDELLKVEIKPCLYTDFFNIEILNSERKIVFKFTTEKLDFKTYIPKGEYFIKVSSQNRQSDIPVYSDIKIIKTEKNVKPKPEPEIQPDIPKGENSEIIPEEKTEIQKPKKVFKDVDANSWYKEYVDYAVENGIFAGTSEDEFLPDKTMTRAEFVQVFANIEGINTDDTNVQTDFSDVEAGMWYSPAIKWATDNKIVSGNGDGTFRPVESVTREMMCVMMSGYFNYKNIKVEKQNNEQKFSDDEKISSWAKEDVYKCYDMKIISGTGNGEFEPKTTASRAVGATIFSDFYKLYIK